MRIGHRFRLGSPIALVMVVLGACLEPYPPPPGTQNLNLLVVDGFLNSTSGLAEVRLSRTLSLRDTIDYPAESLASVRIVKDDGSAFQLPEVEPGVYQAYNNSMSVGSRYHLDITTLSGDKYESDQVLLKQSPLLEDLFWVEEGDGITIKVDTRDPAGTTRYYQWLYTETWEYNSDMSSYFYVYKGTGIPRNREEYINTCYSTVNSSKVLISTTSDQTGDFVNDFPLVHIAGGSKRISSLYSIKVQQRALDEDAYNFWLQLQRTNENLGSLFDPLPSQVIGNVHPTSQQAGKALGYFSGGGVEERRIYIKFRDLPDHLKFTNHQFCPIDSVTFKQVSIYADGTPLISYYGQGLPVGFTRTKNECVDCRTEGGVLEKPSFWPQ